MAEKKSAASPFTGTTEEFEDHDQQHVAPDVIPEGGYGWICVLAVFLVNAFTWGAAAVGHECLRGPLVVFADSNCSNRTVYSWATTYPPKHSQAPPQSTMPSLAASIYVWL